MVCSLVFVVVAGSNEEAVSWLVVALVTGGNEEAVSWLVVALVTSGNDEEEYVGDFDDSEEIKEEEETEPAELVSLSEEPEVELLVGMTDDLDDSENIEVEVVVEEEMTEEEMTGEEVNREEVTEEEITEEEITEVPLLG